MIEPKDTDQFLVDIQHGTHYHVAGCPATTYPPADYTELSYGEIRAIQTHRDGSFEIHACVRLRYPFGVRSIEHDLLHLRTAGCSECRAIADRLAATSEHRIKITYRGWPGHYCSSRYCIFHLNTLLECGDVRVVVSTVGNMWDPRQGTHARPVEVGSGRFYETMAFHATSMDRYWDADVTRVVSITGCRGVDKLDTESDRKAQEMHEAAVQDIARRIQNGEIK